MLWAFPVLFPVLLRGHCRHCCTAGDGWPSLHSARPVFPLSTHLPWLRSGSGSALFSKVLILALQELFGKGLWPSALTDELVLPCEPSACNWQWLCGCRCFTLAPAPCVCSLHPLVEQGHPGPPPPSRQCPQPVRCLPLVHQLWT